MVAHVFFGRWCGAGGCGACRGCVGRRAVQTDASAEQHALVVRRGARNARQAPVGGAVRALPATRQEREHDPITHREAGGRGIHPGLFDDAGSLVPEQHRRRPHTVAVDDREVGVTEARGLDAHEQLSGAGLVELEIADRDRTTVGERARAPDLFEHSSANAHGPLLRGGSVRRDAAGGFHDTGRGRRTPVSAAANGWFTPSVTVEGLRWWKGSPRRMPTGAGSGHLRAGSRSAERTCRCRRGG